MLFPDEKRRPTWLRWTRITLRTCHILCIAGLVGTVLAGADEATFDPWLTAAIASGLALLSTFAYQTLGWFLEISGLVMILKLTALGVMSAHPEWRLPILVGLLIISSFSSHMPGRVRHWVPPPLR